MKKIIRHGNTVELAVYVRECNCGCQFEFGKEDVENEYFDQRDCMTFWYVPCPECGNTTGIGKPEPTRYECI